MASCNHKTNSCKAEGCTEPCWRCCKTHNPNANGKRGRPKRKTPNHPHVHASEDFSNPQPTSRKRRKADKRKANSAAARIISEQANEQDEFDKEFIIPDGVLAAAQCELRSPSCLRNRRSKTRSNAIRRQPRARPQSVTAASSLIPSTASNSKLCWRPRLT